MPNSLAASAAPASVPAASTAKYYAFVVGGLVTVGFGQCLIQWADGIKRRGAPTGRWVAAGTGALIVFNAGLSLFGRGVVERARLERQPERQAEAVDARA